MFEKNKKIEECAKELYDYIYLCCQRDLIMKLLNYMTMIFWVSILVIIVSNIIIPGNIFMLVLMLWFFTQLYLFCKLFIILIQISNYSKEEQN